YNPTANPFTVAFAGLVREGTLTKAISSGYKYVSSLVPVGGTVTSAFGYTPHDQDLIYAWDPSMQSYKQAFTYLDGYGWDPGYGEEPVEPVVSPGEGVLIYSTGENGFEKTSQHCNGQIQCTRPIVAIPIFRQPAFNPALTYYTDQS